MARPRTRSDLARAATSHAQRPRTRSDLDPEAIDAEELIEYTHRVVGESLRVAAQTWAISLRWQEKQDALTSAQRPTRGSS
jgi:hypothetical protein